MQAIRTHRLPATSFKSERMVARCDRGRICVSVSTSLNTEECHVAAARALMRRFASEDEKKYGTPIQENPWMRPFVTGGLPGGTYAHVFLPKPI